ncbi:MFS transporter [Ktedonosporobacter rubrisoli]|uniref:MFS transporter n=1 Tax=Ktedonosporobacter rubrisoli TaxID=2509675 RepID=A0A4V0Z075_KTERU|nr:MFS transporter [Ktedonosporobacter rubrisoli]QBD82241.1 MFS transporter [Ktedonosporobacter rubrisoli]
MPTRPLENGAQIPSLSAQSGQTSLSNGLVFLMALACCLCAANLYYIQPLLVSIAQDFSVQESSVGFIATLSQLGYALGLLLIVPLGDVLNRRDLITISLVGVCLSCIAIALAPSMIFLGVMTLVMGVATVVPQIVVPFAASLAPARERGRVVGAVMSGLLIGVLLARTISGFVNAHLGWRAIYWIAAVLMALLLISLRLLLPREAPREKMHYLHLLQSMVRLLRREPVLIEVSIFGALTFGVFQIFWVTLTFLLSGAPFHFNSDVIGLFGLAGVAGAITASLVGKRTDRTNPRAITGIMMAIVLVTYIIFWLCGQWIPGLIIGVLLLDLGSQGAHISNQARIYARPAENHSRLNTIYMFSYFVGGTLGSALGTTAWSLSGWSGACMLGLAMMIIALGVYLLGIRRARTQSS